MRNSMLIFFTHQMTGLYILILEGGGRCCQRTKLVMLIDLRNMCSPFFLINPNKTTSQAVTSEVVALERSSLFFCDCLSKTLSRVAAHTPT